MPFYCRPCRGIKVLRCHLQHCPSSPASADWWPGQSSICAHAHIHTHSHYHISNPLHAPSGVYWKLQFIHCLLMGGGAWQQPPRPKEWILRPVHSSVAKRERKEVFVLFCSHVGACLCPSLPERTQNNNQPCGCFFFFLLINLLFLRKTLWVSYLISLFLSCVCAHPTVCIISTCNSVTPFKDR